MTPLECVEEFRDRHSGYADVKLAYAGRLDPMASGKLLVLIGQECKKQEIYLRLDKRYKFKILFGYVSDTGDVLGMAKDISGKTVSKKKLDSIMESLVGESVLHYPVFSSKTVNGRPLFLWALEERLDEIDIPTSDTTIYALSCDSLEKMTKESLKENIFTKIQSVSKTDADTKALGRDFRRSEIQQQWRRLFENTGCGTFQIATCTCVCSSGTYIRSLASEVGRRSGVGALVYGIHRTHIGKYQKIGPYGFWKKKF